MDNPSMELAKILEQADYVEANWKVVQILRTVEYAPVQRTNQLFARVLFENDGPTKGFVEEEGDDAVWYALVPMGHCKSTWPRPKKQAPPSDSQLLAEERASHEKTRKALDDALAEVNDLRAKMNDIRVALASRP